ncbi:MAG: hypothetical protein IJL87_03560 [Clostridia bacterium]|nr:hypothetical protein [Clostridia bacterium]
MSTFAEKYWGDCSKAVAYTLNFVQMSYASGSFTWTDYFDSVCPHYKDLSIQTKNFEFPKNSFSKKDYYQLQIGGYGVSQKLMEDMIAFGVERENFKEIYYSRDHVTVLGYSISPVRKLPPIYEQNLYKKKCVCRKCNYYIYEAAASIAEDKAYDDVGYPDYFSQEALDSLNMIAGKVESDDVIISLDLYNYLIPKYPRLECRPVFLGNLKTDDREYLRLHKK